MKADTVPTFVLENLMASVPDSGTPCTEFANGTDIQLTWDSTGTYFTVYAAQDPAPVYSGTAPSCVISGGRQKTTTFTVAAEVVGGVASGTPDGNFENIYLYEPITVTITDPDETPRSVTAGVLTVIGPSSLDSVAAGDAAVRGDLIAAGTTQLDGGAQITDLTVTGAADLQGTTAVTGGYISGSFSVAGSLTSNEVTATDLTVLNGTNMMSYQPIAPHVPYQCSSDGILVGSVWFAGESSQKCSAMIQGIVSGQQTVWATGGNTVVWENLVKYTMWGNANSFTVPVPKGQEFIAVVTQIGDNDIDALTAFWFVPLGLNATVTEVSNDAAAALDQQIAAKPMPSVSVLDVEDRSAAVAEVVAAVSDMIGGQVPDAAAAEFAAAVRSLFTAA
jgi:hypothetical protein